MNNGQLNLTFASIWAAVELRSTTIRSVSTSIAIALTMTFSQLISARATEKLQFTSTSNLSVSDYRQELAHVPLNKTLTDWRYIERANGCIYYDVMIPVTESSQAGSIIREYVIRLAAPIGVQYQPAMVIVPTIRGTALLENKIQKEMCLRGMYSAIADVNEMDLPNQFPDWEFHDRSMKHAIHALRTTIDFLQQIPQVNPEKIGVWGSSLGGITTGVLATVEPRLKAVVIAAGGTNLVDILVKSDQAKVVELRNQRTPYLADSSDETYAAELKKWIHFDAAFLMSEPLNPKEFVPAENILMMVNLTDTKVPTADQLQLWETLGRPERVDLRDSHRLSLLRFTFFHIGQTLDAVQNRLNSKQLASPSGLASISL